MNQHLWRPIKEAPTAGQSILCAFWNPSFNCWVYFVEKANGKNTESLGYAKPTIWKPIIPPPFEFRKVKE